MYTANDVYLVLHESFGWPTALKPHATPIEELLAQGHIPEDIAGQLEAFCQSTGASIKPPYGFGGTGYEWVRYDYNKGGEYWEYYTRIELGMIVEPPVDKKAEAKSVSEWFSNLNIWRDRLGFVLLDDTEFGRADMQRRRDAANFVPPEWGAAGKGDIWRLSILEGDIPLPQDAFSAAYAQITPSLDDVRNLDAQQYLDNLRCDDKSKPRKWLPDGKLNPEFAGF